MNHIDYLMSVFLKSLETFPARLSLLNFGYKKNIWQLFEKRAIAEKLKTY